MTSAATKSPIVSPVLASLAKIIPVFLKTIPPLRPLPTKLAYVAAAVMTATQVLFPDQDPTVTSK